MTSTPLFCNAPLGRKFHFPCLIEFPEVCLSPQVSPVPSKLKLYHLAYQPHHPIFIVLLHVFSGDVEQYWLQYDPRCILLDNSCELEVQVTDY